MTQEPRQHNRPILSTCFVLLVIVTGFCSSADKVKAHKSPQQAGKNTSTVKLVLLKVTAAIFGTVAVIIILYVTRSKWCCIEACRGQGFLKNQIKTQIDAYMPGMRVNDDTGKTEYYEPTEEEMAALGSVLHVIKEMAETK
ncbi:hypothetical protein BV898_11799 [Hypsibius exemplaris]|uniref:Uncharacterized protein n=1 Tax=Hypsibius exemplaris TaxID=2072580 RepID=A0A1W0WFR2_HYPEX|nr:hypothetical protein BV898_11799 [Hypsibius exemplaris]